MSQPENSDSPKPRDAVPLPANRAEELLLERLQAGPVADLSGLVPSERWVRPDFVEALMNGRPIFASFTSSEVKRMSQPSSTGGRDPVAGASAAVRGAGARIGRFPRVARIAATRAAARPDRAPSAAAHAAACSHGTPLNRSASRGSAARSRSGDVLSATARVATRTGPTHGCSSASHAAMRVTRSR